MPLTADERKLRMRRIYGAQKAVATEQGVDEPYVSTVMSGHLHPKTPAAREKLRRVQAAIAAKLGLPVEECFQDEQQEEAAPSLAHASS